MHMKIKKAIIGRKKELEVLQSALASNEAELIAVYGRRRVGKTYLVRTFFEHESIFEFSGVHNASLTEQLLNFRNTLAGYMDTKLLPEMPANWTSAFRMLQQYIEPLLKKKKCVIFLDEFPWLSSPRSRFLQAFEFFWNSWASRHPNLMW